SGDSSIDDSPARTRPCNRCTTVRWDAGPRIKRSLEHEVALDHGVPPDRGDPAPHGWCFSQGWGCRRTSGAGALGSYGRPSWCAHASRSEYSSPPEREVGWHTERDVGSWVSLLRLPLSTPSLPPFQRWLFI